MGKLIVVVVVVAVAVFACMAFPFWSPPVEIEFRESWIGFGAVPIIHNVGEDELFDLEVRGDAPGGQTQTVNFYSLPPRTFQEAGWWQFDGWVPVRGETITVRARGYLFGKSVRVPFG